MNKNLLFLLILISSLASAEHSLFIGVSEQPQCNKDVVIAARPLFYQEEKDWIPIFKKGNFKTIFSGDFKWNIAFDGRNFGTIKTRFSNNPINTKGDSNFTKDSLLTYHNPEKAPKILNTGQLFSGWCSHPTYRPIILVSSPNHKDPEEWKPFTPNDSYKRLLFSRMKASLGDRAVSCQDYDWDTVKPYNFKSEELLLYKSYRSNSGKELVSISIDTSKITCDGPIEPEWDITWFFIDRDNISLLGRSLNLVDAGDYDNDGKSEIIFWFRAYNEDGYIIFYDDFKKSSRFTWSYH